MRAGAPTTRQRDERQDGKPKRLLGSTVGIAHADRRLVIADRPVTPITEIEKSPRQSLRDAPTTMSGHLRTETC